MSAPIHSCRHVGPALRIEGSEPLESRLSQAAFPASGVSSTDPARVVTVFAYDARGLLTATTENAVAGATPSASVNVTTSTSY